MRKEGDKYRSFMDVRKKSVYVTHSWYDIRDLVQSPSLGIPLFSGGMMMPFNMMSPMMPSTLMGPTTSGQ